MNPVMNDTNAIGERQRALFGSRFYEPTINTSSIKELAPERCGVCTVPRDQRCYRHCAVEREKLTSQDGVTVT